MAVKAMAHDCNNNIIIIIIGVCDGLGFICDLINDNYYVTLPFNLFCVNLCAKVFLSPLFL